ncbi:MAG: trehalase family glycosidase [Oscillospiraceae bacterium]|nr:trehalase family glycosidase [Oscillospiraceae bacterium]
MTLKSFPRQEEIALSCRQILNRIRTVHLREINGSEGPVLYISDAYPGVWLEHVYDGLVWAELTGENQVARSYVRLFLKHQKPDGQLPCYVWRDRVGYSQLQECVSFASIGLEVFQRTQDRPFLEELYDGCCRWDSWLCANRLGKAGLLEMYCGYDSGHDNSGRLDGMKYPGNVCEDAAVRPEGCPIAPIIAPDINAVFYGDRTALAEMATLLGREQEALLWRQKAEAVRENLFRCCYDEADRFFYDVDRQGRLRKCRSISITNVFSERVTDPALTAAIFDRYFRSPSEFGTPFPYPSVSAGDPLFEKRVPGNSWGYYCQGLTMLRTLRWMKAQGLEQELHENMRKWLTAWTGASLPFGQELDPFTGEPSESSPWYSATMLFYLASAKELGLVRDFGQET